jgi:hypothetical protein
MCDRRVRAQCETVMAGNAAVMRYHDIMAKTISLRLSDDVYEAVKRHAAADNQSMNAWIETLLDIEDMRRRCAAHGQWMSEHPEAVAATEAWADENLEELPRR